MQTALKEGISVVIDAENPSKALRAKYISVAVAARASVKCLHFRIDLDTAMHLDKFRSLTMEVPVTPDKMFISYRNRHQPPEVSDGIDRVIDIAFVPCFETVEARELLQMYLW